MRVGERGRKEGGGKNLRLLFWSVLLQISMDKDYGKRLHEVFFFIITDISPHKLISCQYIHHVENSEGTEKSFTQLPRKIKEFLII